MKTIEIKLFKFNELSDDAKHNALENLLDINIDYDWWEFIKEDAKEIGLNIISFDIDRGNYCKVEYNFQPAITKELILQKHGKNCNTYQTVKNSDLRKIGEDEEMLKALSEDYLQILKDEFDYRCSKEAILETIEANEYDFTENGKLH